MVNRTEERTFWGCNRDKNSFTVRCMVYVFRSNVSSRIFKTHPCVFYIWSCNIIPLKSLVIEHRTDNHICQIT